jgi:sugar phosphate isomerase/epimerase
MTRPSLDRLASLGAPALLAALLLGPFPLRGGELDGQALSGGQARPQVNGRPLAMDDLVAWCIVPFDSRKRSPEERVAMLERLGFERYAYDWRAEHLPDTARELRLAREHGIRVEAVWVWIEKDQPGRLSESNERLLSALKEAGLSTQLWVGFAPGFFEGMTDEQKVARGAEMVRHLSDRAAETKSRVALYNHGDWFGEPENQVRIIQALPGRDVGIVYNFHHGHQQIDRFDALVKAIRPYLWVVNLNGMRPEGPKILPFGTGTEERRMLQTVLDSGFTGPFGVLGHVDDADVEVILRGNLRGLGFTPK